MKRILVCGVEVVDWSEVSSFKRLMETYKSSKDHLDLASVVDMPVLPRVIKFDEVNLVHSLDPTDQSFILVYPVDKTTIEEANFQIKVYFNKELNTRLYELQKLKTSFAETFN